MNKIHYPQRCDGVIPGVYTRRQMLRTLTTGFGYMAFAGLATQSALAAAQAGGQVINGAADNSLLLPKKPHFAPRAKRIIFLGMEGAPSHVDTFDYKVKLQSDDGKHIVIRPLAYVKEVDMARYAEVKGFPIIPCDLCGSQENLQRKQIKAMLREWDKKTPGRVDNVFAALSTVAPSHLLDRNLFDFANLQVTGEAVQDGDIAFDEEPCSTGSIVSSVIPLHSLE